jgi:hypothetical protein
VLASRPAVARSYSTCIPLHLGKAFSVACSVQSTWSNLLSAGRVEGQRCDGFPRMAGRTVARIEWKSRISRALKYAIHSRQRKSRSGVECEPSCSWLRWLHRVFTAPPKRMRRYQCAHEGKSNGKPWIHSYVIRRSSPRHSFLLPCTRGAHPGDTQSRAMPILPGSGCSSCVGIVCPSRSTVAG